MQYITGSPVCGNGKHFPFEVRHTIPSVGVERDHAGEAERTTGNILH